MNARPRLNTLARRGLLFLALAIACLLRADPAGPGTAVNRMAGFPRLILWAWERPEDLRFIDTRKVGVAFLARTFTLHGDEVLIRPRLQPLRVLPGTALVAVARIESDRSSPPSLSPGQRRQLVQGIAEIARLPEVSAVQVDFDAVASQRDFYRSTLVELRRRLPRTFPLSMTALASWCLEDNWLNGLPIDEAVPMLFEMGPDGGRIERHLNSGGEFSAPVCGQSIGMSASETLGWAPPERRRYVFRANSWTAENLAEISSHLRSE